LERSIGVSVKREEILNGVKDKDIETIRPPEYDAPESIVERALSLRPEKTAYGFYQKRAGELIRAAEGERMPAVSLSGGFNASGNSYVTDEDEWFAQLTLQWTIFDGGCETACKNDPVKHEIGIENRPTLPYMRDFPQ
jgi:outer membrane protein TolC